MHVWTTKDGRHIPVPEMTDDHLRNAERYARRAQAHHLHWAGSALSYASSAPDGAAYAAEQSADESFDQYHTWSYWHQVFSNELQQRNLQPYAE